MAVPNWVLVRSHVGTLQALNRFANTHNVNIRVRFITLDRALGDLKNAWEKKGNFKEIRRE